MSALNYRHLHYFWVVAKEGGFARGAERLGMAVQTVSTQVRELERALGRQLLKPAGRGVALSEAGELAFARAEALFAIGEALPEELRQAEAGASVRLAVGLSDGLSKLAAHALLQPLLGTPRLRLLCHEGEFEPLLGELSLHQLDVVLAGQAAPPNPSLRLSSQRLVASPVDWYGPSEWLRRVRGRELPGCLEELPVLLPTGHSTLRASLDAWFDERGIRPRIAGEFEDSALMAVFASQGLGVFPVSRLGVDNLIRIRGLRRLGACDGLSESIYAIRSRRGANHPLVRRLLGDAGG